jgi:tetratricopeptide (TPR) repeat protein
VHPDDAATVVGQPESTTVSFDEFQHEGSPKKEQNQESPPVDGTEDNTADSQAKRSAPAPAEAGTQPNEQQDEANAEPPAQASTEVQPSPMQKNQEHEAPRPLGYMGATQFGSTWAGSNYSLTSVRRKKRVLWSLVGFLLLAQGIVAALVVYNARTAQPLATKVVPTTQPLSQPIKVAPPKPDSSQLYSTAKALAKAGKFIEALEALRKMKEHVADPELLALAGKLEQTIRIGPQLLQARKLIGTKNYQAAIYTLEGALSQVPNHPEAKSLMDSAKKAMRDAKPSDTRGPKKARKYRRRARKKAPKPALLDFEATPTARVSVDKTDMGYTPLRGIRVAPGAHEILMSRKGYQPYRLRVVTVQGGVPPPSPK